MYMYMYMYVYTICDLILIFPQNNSDQTHNFTHSSILYSKTITLSTLRGIIIARPAYQISLTACTKWLNGELLNVSI